MSEQSQKIRQLLGEGTGGMRTVSTQPSNSNWRDIAKQNIQEIASKQGSKNFAYLDKFKESLDSRKNKPKNENVSLLNKFPRSRSEARPSSGIKALEISKVKLDINTKHLLSTQRRFSESRSTSRPHSAQPSSDIRRSHTGLNSEINLKKSKVHSIIDSLQRLRTTNYTPTASVVGGLGGRQRSERLIESASKSKINTDRLLATPNQWTKNQISQKKTQLKSGLKGFGHDLETKNVDFSSNNNFLTPKARLVFNKRKETTNPEFGQRGRLSLTKVMFDYSILKTDINKKGKALEAFSDLESYKSFIHNKKETESSRFGATTKIPDSRVEYTRKFLENALGKKPSIARNSALLKESAKKGTVLGDWFTFRGNNGSE